jgi:hypothetical protein
LKGEESFAPKILFPSNVVLETSRTHVQDKINHSYLRYSNIAAKTLRSVLVADVKAQALKREEIALKKAIWQGGKMGESVSFDSC